MNINIRIHSLKLLTLAGALGFSGCATEIGQDGRPHNVLTPAGAAALQAVTAAGIGAGTGALMRGVNPVAAGAISAGAGSIASQAINAFVLSQQQATLQQKKTAEVRAQHLYEKLNDQEKAQVKTIAVVTKATDSTRGVPIMYVDPKTMQVQNNNTVYDCTEKPKVPSIKSSDVAMALN